MFTGINCSRNIISLPHYHYSSLLSSNSLNLPLLCYSFLISPMHVLMQYAYASLSFPLQSYSITYPSITYCISCLSSESTFFYLLSLSYYICICIIFAGASSLLASVLGGGAATPPAGSEETIEGEINRRRVI